MGISATEYAALLSRVQAIESRLNNIQYALLKMVTVEQAEQLGLIGQNEVEELEAVVQALVSRVTLLEGYHAT